MIPPFYLLPVLVVAVGCSLPGLIANLRASDRFIQHLYEDHRDLWEKLGGPTGWQWSPPGRWATCGGSNLFQEAEPEWLKRTPELVEAFRAVRAGRRQWNLVVAPTVGLVGLMFLLNAWFWDAGK